ncbi:hypothetical protein Mapa_007291 [Marchantia paleacea]|nr:hypothetical protein Mapa_007291 [Marchantia paleacea]
MDSYPIPRHNLTLLCMFSVITQVWTLICSFGCVCVPACCVQETSDAACCNFLMIFFSYYVHSIFMMLFRSHITCLHGQLLACYIVTEPGLFQPRSPCANDHLRFAESKKLVRGIQYIFLYTM